MKSREGRILTALEETDKHFIVHMLPVGQEGTFMTTLGVELLSGLLHRDSLLAGFWQGIEGLTEECCMSLLLLFSTDRGGTCAKEEDGTPSEVCK